VGGKDRVLTWIVSTIVSETIWQRSPAEHAASFSAIQVLSRACLGKSSPITQLGVHKSGSQKLQHVLAPSSSSESLLKVQPATPETTVWIRPPDGCPEPGLPKKGRFLYGNLENEKRESVFHRISGPLSTPLPRASSPSAGQSGLSTEGRSGAALQPFLQKRCFFELSFFVRPEPVLAKRSVSISQ
jgi:hypothetical protein